MTASDIEFDTSDPARIMSDGLLPVVPLSVIVNGFYMGTKNEKYSLHVPVTPRGVETITFYTDIDPRVAEALPGIAIEVKKDK